MSHLLPKIWFWIYFEKLLVTAAIFFLFFISLGGGGDLLKERKQQSILLILFMNGLFSVGPIPRGSQLWFFLSVLIMEEFWSYVQVNQTDSDLVEYFFVLFCF